MGAYANRLTATAAPPAGIAWVCRDKNFPLNLTVQFPFKFLLKNEEQGKMGESGRKWGEMWNNGAKWEKIRKRGKRLGGGGICG